MGGAEEARGAPPPLPLPAPCEVGLGAFTGVPSGVCSPWGLNTSSTEPVGCTNKRLRTLEQVGEELRPRWWAIAVVLLWWW